MTDKREQLAAALRKRVQTSDPARRLSDGQRALWLLQQVAPESPAYNIAFAARVIGPVEAHALRAAVQTVVDRHESLRSRFPGEQGEPRRIVGEHVQVPWHEVDATGWDRDRLLSAIRAEIDTPFDLAAGPLLRVRLWSGAAGETHLAVTCHHIVLDGWSLWIVLSEVGALYTAAVGATEVVLPSAVPYARYLQRQAEIRDGDDGARHRSFWLHRLAGDPPPLNLPADRPRPPAPTYRGAAHRIRLGADLTARLSALAREGRATVQMSILALFQALLYRYTGQEDLTVGYLASGRARPELEPIVGYLANPLALRSWLHPEATFRQLLQQVRNLLLDALDHQEYPFSLVVHDVSPDRDVSRSPLFQALFVYEKPQLLEDQHVSSFIVGEAGARMTLGALALESLPFSAQREGQFDLTLVLAEIDGELVLSFDYATDLFDAPTILRLASHFEQLAATAAADPDQPIGRMSILSAEDRALVHRLNATACEIPDVSFHQLVEAHARRQPEAIALVFEGLEITYGDLNRQADRFARRLRQHGVVPDTIVGLFVDRSPDLIVALLGILKAGGAFLPLDPTYPQERLSFMVADSRAAVLVTTGALADRLPDFRGGTVRIDEGGEGGAATDAMSAVPSRSLAYVIYTSGSTGRPKGTLLEHRGLVNVALEQQRMFGVGPGARVLQFASLSYDAAVFEVAMALGSGATLCLARPASLLPGTPLLETLRANQVNVITVPPSALLNLPIAELPALSTITVAGEACPAELVTRWAAGRAFFNLYGPTESTIWATAARCADGGRTPTIGRPIANTRVHVLDANLQQVPIGVPGELYIAGAGLARGYHERPELTSTRFIANPFSQVEGDRLYKTGDLVRLLASGDIEFLGRIDQQVKIRGFRIELGEIEAVVGQQPDVNEAVAVVRDDGPAGQRIVAYVVLKPGVEQNVTALRGYLKSRLPDFMVPSAIVFMERLPLSPSGKVNRRALPAPDDSRSLEDSYVAPATPLEEQIAGIWREVLRVPRVGVHDNFFDLGGTSLLIARVHARLHGVAPAALSIVDLFQHPTVRALAARLEQPAPAPSSSVEVERGDVMAAGRARLRDQARRRGAHDAPSAK